MQSKTDNKVALKLNDPRLLPHAAHLILFTKTRILYKGKLLTSKIITNSKGRLIRAIEVGDYLYIEQEKYGTSNNWAVLARQGHHILWIAHKPTKKLVGKVVDGKVSKL